MHGHLFFCFYLFYITCSYCGSWASISVISIRRYLQKNIQNLRVNLTCLVWADILMSLLKLNLKIICIISKVWWKQQEVLNLISWLQWKPLKAGHCLQRQTIWRVHRLSYRHLPAHLSHIALFLYQPTVLSKILLRQFDGVWLPDYLLFGLVCFAGILSVVSDCIRLYLHLLFSCKRVLTLTSTVM